MYAYGQNLVHAGAYFALDDGCELPEDFAYDRDFLVPRSVNAAVYPHRENVTLGRVALQYANGGPGHYEPYNDIGRLIILLKVPAAGC